MNINPIVNVDEFILGYGFVRTGCEIVTVIEIFDEALKGISRVVWGQWKKSWCSYDKCGE